MRIRLTCCATSGTVKNREINNNKISLPKFNLSKIIIVGIIIIAERYGLLNFFQVFVTSKPGDMEIKLAKINDLNFIYKSLLLTLYTALLIYCNSLPLYIHLLHVL